MERRHPLLGSGPPARLRDPSPLRTATLADGGPRPARPPDTQHSPQHAAALSVWDPLFAWASQLKASFSEPVRAKVFEALGVLKELSGKRIEVEDDLAVDVFAFALLELLARDAGTAGARLDKLLQLLAAHIFHSPRNPSITNREFFWVFVRDLALKYQGPPQIPAAPPDLHAVLDRFLSHYHLNGEENADIIAGLERLIAPFLEEARRIVGDPRWTRAGEA